MTYRLTRRALLGAYALVIIVPLVVVLFGTFKTTSQVLEAPFAPPTNLSPTNYATVLGEKNLGQALLNSIIVTGVAVPFTLFLASLAAYALSRVAGIIAWLIYGFLILGMAVPPQANMIPQFVLFDMLGLTNNLFGLILIETVIGLPVAVFILTGFMRTLPVSLFEAGEIDGAGPWRLYRTVALPLALPSLAAAAIFLFVIQWNDLLYPLLFIQDPALKTLPLALLDFQGQFLTDYPLLFTGVTVASTPVVVAYVFLQRYFVEGMTAGAVKG